MFNRKFLTMLETWRLPRLLRPDRARPASVDPALRLPFAEWVCLALITQKVSHGWALGTMLAPDGELGRIWTLSRPLTYRAIDGLVDKALITRRPVTPPGGAATGSCSRQPSPAAALAKRWLDTPVEHLRDVRTELLVKLSLRERAGLDNQAAARPPAGAVRGDDRRSHVDRPRRRPRRSVAPRERPGRAPLPRARRCIQLAICRRRRPPGCGSAPATSSAAP